MLDLAIDNSWINLHVVPSEVLIIEGNLPASGCPLLSREISILVMQRTSEFIVFSLFFPQVLISFAQASAHRDVAVFYLWGFINLFRISTGRKVARMSMNLVI
jgi:hypothetical protein